MVRNVFVCSILQSNLGDYFDFTEMVEYVGVWDGLLVHTVESFDSTVLYRPARWYDR